MSPNRLARLLVSRNRQVTLQVLLLLLANRKRILNRRRIVFHRQHPSPRPRQTLHRRLLLLHSLLLNRNRRLCQAHHHSPSRPLALRLLATLELCPSRKHILRPLRKRRPKLPRLHLRLRRRRVFPNQHHRLKRARVHRVVLLRALRRRLKLHPGFLFSPSSTIRISCIMKLILRLFVRFR